MSQKKETDWLLSHFKSGSYLMTNIAINKFLVGFSDINNNFNSDIATLPSLHP